jgi:hypothetical protein
MGFEMKKNSEYLVRIFFEISIIRSFMFVLISVRLYILFTIIYNSYLIIYAILIILQVTVISTIYLMLSYSRRKNNMPDLILNHL